MAVDANSKQIIFKSAQRSKIVRENFDDKDAEVNDLQAQINNLTTAPAGNEVTNARDYHVVLRDRLRSVSQGHVNQIIDGFDVLEQATPDMTIKVKAGDGIVDGVGVIKGFGTWTRSGATVTITELNHGLSNGNNIYVDVTSSAPALPATAEYTVANAATDTFDITGVAAGDTTGTAEYSRYSATITAPTNKRWDVVVIDSGNTISVLSGNDSNDRTLPTVSSTQRPIALIDLDSATATITDSLITDISNQGCLTGNKWFFKIQDAINSLNDRTNSIERGQIFIHKGEYYEEVNLTGKNNVSLIFENQAKLYRIDNSSYCIKSINTVTNETVGIKIINADLFGNGKAGVIELLKFEYTDECVIKNCGFDGNLSAVTNLNKNYYIENCYKISFVKNQFDTHYWDFESSRNSVYRNRKITHDPKSSLLYDMPSNNSGALIADITVNQEPDDMAFDGRYMYVCCIDANKVDVIDTLTMTRVSQIAVGVAPTSITFDGRYMYVLNQTDADVTRIDTIAQAVDGADIAVGGTPLWIEWAGKYVFVSNNADADVSVIDTTDWTKGTDIAVGTNPRGMAFDGLNLWVCNLGDNDVSPIDTSSLTKGTDVAVGLQPEEIVFDGHLLWVLNTGDNDISIIDAKTKAKLTSDVSMSAVGTGGRKMFYLNGRIYVETADFVEIIDCHIQQRSDNGVFVLASTRAIGTDGRYLYMGAVNGTVLKVNSLLKN